MEEKDEINQKKEIINYFFDDKTNKIKEFFDVLIKDLRYEKEEKDEYTLINKENEIVLCKKTYLIK